MPGNSTNNTTIWTPGGGYDQGWLNTGVSSHASDPVSSSPWNITNPAYNAETNPNAPQTIQDPNATATPTRVTPNASGTTGIQNPFGLVWNKSQNNGFVPNQGGPSGWGYVPPTPQAPVSPQVSGQGTDPNTTYGPVNPNANQPYNGSVQTGQTTEPDYLNDPAAQQAASASGVDIQDYITQGWKFINGKWMSPRQIQVQNMNSSQFTQGEINPDAFQPYNGTTQASQAPTVNTNTATPNTNNNGTFQGPNGSQQRWNGSNWETITPPTTPTTQTPNTTPPGGTPNPFLPTYQNDIQISNPLGVNAGNPKQFATQGTANDIAKLLGGNVIQDQLQGPGYSYSSPMNLVKVGNNTINAGLAGDTLSKYGSEPGSYGRYLVDKDAGLVPQGYDPWATKSNLTPQQQQAQGIQDPDAYNARTANNNNLDLSFLSQLFGQQQQATSNNNIYSQLAPLLSLLQQLGLFGQQRPPALQSKSLYGFPYYSKFS